VRRPPTRRPLVKAFVAGSLRGCCHQADPDVCAARFWKGEAEHVVARPPVGRAWSGPCPRYVPMFTALFLDDAPPRLARHSEQAEIMQLLNAMLQPSGALVSG
jgi:hypothetical protein